jgi:hypothetical protein
MGPVCVFLAVCALAHAVTIGESAAHSFVSAVLLQVLPSPVAIVWLLMGFLLGVTVGCFGATTIQSCGSCSVAHAVPVLVATAALYALTPAI